MENLFLCTLHNENVTYRIRDVRIKQSNCIFYFQGKQITKKGIYNPALTIQQFGIAATKIEPSLF